MEHEKDMSKTANDEGEEFPCDGLVMVGASWIVKDLHHESGFLAHDPITYIEAGGRRILVTDDSDVPRARASSRADEVWSENEFDLRGEAARRGSRHAARLELTVRAVRRAGLDAVVVPDWFPRPTRTTSAPAASVFGWTAARWTRVDVARLLTRSEQ